MSRLRKLEEERKISDWANEQSPDSLKGKVSQGRELRERSGKQSEIKPRTLQEIDKVTKKEVISALERMISESSKVGNRVHVADLEKSVMGNPRKLAELQKMLGSNKTPIEKELKKMLEKKGIQDVRYGVVDNKLYAWTRNTGPMNLANAYGSQFYYFKSKQEMYRFLRESSRRLGIQGNTRESMKKLESLLNQMQSEKTKFAGQNVSPLGLKAGRVKGEALHFQLDTRKQSLQSLEGKISKVTGPDGHGGIKNPKFPEGEKLETAFSRLAATVKSDGQLRETGKISYTEADKGRLNQVERDLQAFGEISLRRLDRGGKQEASFPAPLGRALQNMGFRSGDKGILNDGLPPPIMQSSPKARRAYLQDLIPEDGNFHPTAGFSWTRSNVLNAGTKSEKYGFSDKLSERAVAFVKEGTPENKSTSRGWGELQKLAKTGHPEAREIVAAVRENPNRLIRDEAKLAESLGIGVTVRPVRVRVMEKTDRVSVQWVGKTAGLENAEKWAKLCPPNDLRKRRAVDKWLKGRHDSSS
jgi:hypothetical protein